MRSTIRSRRMLATLVALLLAFSAAAAGASSATAAPRPPKDEFKMSALGDSITLATMTCNTLSGCPANSWSTGTSSSVNSHLLRLSSLRKTKLTGTNNAVNGATSFALPDQAAAAVTQGAKYVTIEIGANDACTSTVAEMTPTGDFRANIDSALATLAGSTNSPEIFVASIPNLQRMYDLNKSSSTARSRWSTLKICQSLLANPASTGDADVTRRAAVVQQVTEYNQALDDACAVVPKCRFDGYAIAKLEFGTSDISTRDYFHPSLAGQAKMADTTWLKTQWVAP